MCHPLKFLIRFKPTGLHTDFLCLRRYLPDIVLGVRSVTISRSEMKGLVWIIFLSTVELKPENADEVRRNFDALNEVLKVTQFLESYDKTLGELYYLDTLADWNYSTNITEANDQATRVISKKLREYEAEAFKVADAFDKTLLDDHPDLLRMLKQVGAKSLPEAEAQELEAAIQAMGSVYGKTKVCLENKPDECYNLGTVTNMYILKEEDSCYFSF